MLRHHQSKVLRECCSMDAQFRGKRPIVALNPKFSVKFENHGLGFGLKQNASDDALKILVGNKCDLGHLRQVESSKGQQVYSPDEKLPDPDPASFSNLEN